MSSKIELTLAPELPFSGVYPHNSISQKVDLPNLLDLNSIPDSLRAWAMLYQQLAVVGVRSIEVAKKISLHLQRFIAFFEQAYGHDHISSCLRRDVLSWQAQLLTQQLAPATINNHLASLSTFTTWVHSQAPHLFALGDPAKGIGELGLPPLEPRALNEDQIRSLKNICERLERFHQLKGRHWHKHSSRSQPQNEIPTHAQGRPLRDRAIVFVLLSTGLRREELSQLDLAQLVPNSALALRTARQARFTRVRGKGKSERNVFLSADARIALADYLERERPGDANLETTKLFLSARGVGARAANGQLSSRSLNWILAQIGRWHDSEMSDPARQISPLRPHDLRHTFAFQLAKVTGADSYELERRLGHRSQRYIQRYTNPPAVVAASYVEQL